MNIEKYLEGENNDEWIHMVIDSEKYLEMICPEYLEYKEKYDNYEF